MSDYDDILHCPRPPSRRARMTPGNRAAQFAPFAALTGYDEAVAETARLTDCRRELDDSEKERLNGMLLALAERVEARPEVEVTWFAPDARKDGGAYVTSTGRLKKIDPIAGCLCLTDGKVIPFSQLYGLLAPDVDKEKWVIYNEAN